MYENEVDVGRAVRQSGLVREDVFVSECSECRHCNFLRVGLHSAALSSTLQVFHSGDNNALMRIV